MVASKLSHKSEPWSYAPPSQNLQIVNIHVEQIHGFDAAGLWVDEVEGRRPVVALVVLDTGRGAVGIQGLRIGHGEREVASSLDGVNVTGSHAGVDDRVHTPGHEIALAIEMVDGESTVLGVVSRDGCGEDGQQCAGGELHFGYVYIDEKEGLG